MLPRLSGWGLVACLLAAGCTSDKLFEEVAPGVGVSRKSIDDYAEQHGLSRDEAKHQIAAEMMSSQDTGAATLEESAAASADGASAAQ